MKNIRAMVAATRSEIADTQRVRHQVFVKEKGLLSHHETTLDREMDSYDDLATTLHFIAYVDRVPVATARLIGHNPSVARSIGQPIGIDLSTRYDLAPFAVAGVSVAEVSRMCVVAAHRGSEVRNELFIAMCRESRHVGLTHWVGAGNADTDALEDAEIAYQIALRDGLMSPHWRVAPRPGASAVAPSSQPVYSAIQRAQAQAGDLRGLRLPRTLETLTTHLAARCMGRPIREQGYTVCSLPLVVDLAQVVHPASLLRSRAHY